jgi:hypothetical protein
VLAPDVRDEGAWVDTDIDATRSQDEMKVNVAAARLGLDGTRGRGIALALRPIYRDSSVESPSPGARIQLLVCVSYVPEPTVGHSVMLGLRAGGSHPRWCY